MQHASGLTEGVAGYVEAKRETGCGQKRARCPEASFSPSETDTACLRTDLGSSDGVGFVLDSPVEAFTDAVCLRALGFDLGMVDVLDGQIRLVFAGT